MRIILLIVFLIISTHITLNKSFSDTLVGTNTTTNETVIGTTTTTTSGTSTITTNDVITDNAPEIGDTLIETKQTTTTPIIEQTYENVQVDTTTTNTYQTGTTTTQNVTENLITPGSNTYHTVNLCSQTDVSCSGQVITGTGYGSGGGYGVEFGYAGGTVTINRDLEDYLSGAEGNVTVTQGADIRLNCSNRIGGSGCAPTSPTNDHVIMTLRATDSTGNSITQTRDVTGYWTNFQRYTNTIIFNSNNSADWNIQASYFGRDYGYWGPLGSEWFGPNIDNLTLTAQTTEVISNVSTYTTSSTSTSYFDRLISSAVTGYNTLIETISSTVIGCESKSPPTCETQEALKEVSSTTTEIDKSITESVSTLKTETLENTVTTSSTEPELETQSDSLSSSTPSTNQSSPAQETASTDQTTSSQESTSDQTTPQESQTQDQASSTEDSGNQTESSGEQSAESTETSDTSTEAADSNSDVSLGNDIANIDVNVKDPGKNMEMKNAIMLSKMADNSALKTYASIPFYKYKAIYEDQIDIRDDRILYADASLLSYMEKDPVFKKQNLLYNIKIQKQKLLNEIEVLKK